MIRYTKLPCPTCPKFKEDIGNCSILCEPFEEWARLVEKVFGKGENDHD